MLPSGDDSLGDERAKPRRGECARGLHFEVLTVLVVTILPLAFVSIRDALTREAPRFSWGVTAGGVWFGALNSVAGLLLVAYVAYQRGESRLHFGWNLRPVVLPASLGVFLAAIAAYSLACLVIASLGVADYDTGRHSSGREIREVSEGLLLVMVVISAVFEEVVTRAYLMTRLRDMGLSPAWGVVASAVVQTSYHVHKGAAFLPGYSAIFVVFSLYFARYANLPVVILAHLYVNIIWWALR